MCKHAAVWFEPLCGLSDVSAFDWAECRFNQMKWAWICGRIRLELRLVFSCSALGICYCYCPPTCPTASLSFLFTHLRSSLWLWTVWLCCGNLPWREERWSKTNTEHQFSWQTLQLKQTTQKIWSGLTLARSCSKTGSTVHGWIWQWNMREHLFM